ncbi:MAG: methionine--tRNA ligase [Candidatus Aenigmarchaeota archaeon]|nr:methionine--tRNA ligase [Candidatus Aenigmarchaeota archaeon]
MDNYLSGDTLKKYYVTTPIYYVNDVPHIGHAFTSLFADVMARWHRLNNEDVFFLTGTDEHGKKIEKAAAKSGKNPKDFVDQMSESFKQLCKTLNISNDCFIRTTDSRHKKIVKDIIQQVAKSGDIYKGVYSGWYCVPDETYWIESQLVDGKCPSCSRVVEKISEESYFFKLSNYQDKLLKFYKEHPEFIQPENRKQEIINRVQQGLHDLSITRSTFNWGIEFPLDKKHVVYVWFDALLSYVSAFSSEKNRQKHWPPDLQVMAKEILWFHSVIWPAMLMSMKKKLPEAIFAHGWLTVDGRKMSKSVGNVVDPFEMAEKYSADAIRFFLFRDISLEDDGDFSEKHLVERVNTELIDNYCNLFYRITSFIVRNYQGIPTPSKFSKNENELIRNLNKTASAVENHFKTNRPDKALTDVLKLSSELNKYFQELKPWEDPNTAKAKTGLYVAANVLNSITHMLLPFAPVTLQRAQKILNAKMNWKDITTFELEPKQKISAKILMEKLEFKEIIVPKLIAGNIKSVSEHPNADKLYVLEVDIGAESRQIVAALKSYYTPGQLKNRTVIVVANLEPSIIRSVESQGMLLACENGVLLETKAIVGTKGSDCMKKINYKKFSEFNLRVEKGKLTLDGKLVMFGNQQAYPERKVVDGTRVM